jgi:hypothetical protein
MELSFSEVMALIDKGHQAYEIWKSPIYVGTRNGKGGGDYYSDPVLQIQSFSDTSRLPLKVTKMFAPIKKLKTNNSIHRWSYGAGYSASSDIQTLLEVFKQAGYPVVRVEPHKDNFGNTYQLFLVVNIGGK